MDNRKPPKPTSSLASNVPLNIVIDDKKRNKFSSILITQLNETINSADDIDVKVLSSVYENKDKICESIECQTDNDVKFEKYFTHIKPTFSDIESVGFYYFDADSNSYVISDDEFVVEENLSDECIGFEVYNRKSNKMYTEPKSMLKYKVMSTQTVLSILPERNRSTQTSPSLLRDYLMNDLTNILSSVDYVRPTNEDFVNKLRNEQQSLLLVSRSDSINEESLKSSSESTSFENPLSEKNILKNAEICQNDSDKLKKYNVQNADSINSENNSFYTVASHFTSTTTVPSENCTINEPESFEQFDILEVIDNYFINGQVVSLNKTLNDTASSSSSSDEDQINHEDNERNLAQSDRTSIVSDVNSDDDDDDDDDEIEEVQDKPMNTIAGLMVAGKLLKEFHEETMIEEEYVKDKYEIYYPESDKVIAEQKASEILNEVTHETTYDESKRKIKFNDDLDIIDPSEYSTPTTSTSNLQQFLSSDSFQRIDCSTSDDAEISPPPVLPKSNETKRESIKYNNFSSFKWQAPTPYEKIPQTKTDQSSSTINEWDNTPVKPYNSTFDTKSANKLNSNLEKTLKTFDMKESKKGVKYIEKHSNVDIIPNNIFASESLERRLRASGFNDLITSNDASRKSKPPLSPQIQLPVLDTKSPVRSESPESPPPPLPVISPPPIAQEPPERPPLPNLPLSNPILPPRISQNSKNEATITDKPPLPVVLKKQISNESLDGAIKINGNSTINSEIDQIDNNRRGSNSSIKQVLIVDNIEETTVSTAIITKQTIIKNEDYFHSPLSPLQNMQKIESESLNESSSSDMQTNKKHTNESKFTFDEPSFKKFDVDLTFYDEESVIINHEQTSSDNFYHTETSKEEKASTPKERHLSTESKIILDIKKPNIIVDFSIYDEEPKNPEVITTSDLTDVTTTTTTSRERFSSFSNESKLLLNTSVNVPTIDVDFSIYDEEPQINKTPVDDSTIREEQSEKSKQSLVKESKLFLNDLQPIKQFDINFDEYEQQIAPEPVKPQQKVNLSLSNTSSYAEKTTSSDTASTTRHRFQEIDIPIPTSLSSRKTSLSTESKLFINNENKNIIKFDVDFSIYDEEPKAKPLSKNSIIRLDKENTKRFDVDFDLYDENKASLNNSFNENKRDKLKQIDNIISYQSPNSSSQSAQKKQPMKYYFPDWENMLNTVQVHQVENNQDDGSYNIDCSDNEDNNGNDDDDAGTEADIDDNDDQENDVREFELNNNTNGIVNMVFEPVVNHAEIFNNAQISPKKFINEQISPKLFDYEQISPKKFYNEQMSPKKFQNFFPPKKNQDYAPQNQIYSLKDIDKKINVSSVAPTGVLQQTRKPDEHFFTTHVERGEIRIDDKYDAQFEVSGYTPGSAQNQPVLFKKPIIQIADSNTIQPRLKIIPKENDKDIQNLLSIKRLHNKSGASLAETSSIITETSVDTSFKETGKYIKNETYNGKISRIQKLMLSIADREKQKLLRRLDRRKERVPEILELLKTAKGKEKKRLEEELALLLRKEKKDEQLKRKFNLIDELVPKHFQNKSINKVESEEVLDHEVSDINTVKSSRSASATSLRFQAGSGSASGFSVTSGIFNDGYSSAGGASLGSKNRLSSIKSGARESGYSSCDESVAEIRNRKRYSSYGSESRLERVEDDYSALYPHEQTNENIENPSSLHTAIRSAVNRLPIDSSTINMPSNYSRVLTKSPTLQIGYSNIQQPAAYKTIKFPPNSNFASHADENDDEYPQYEYRIPRNQIIDRNQQIIELHSTDLRPPINSCMKSFTSNRDKDKSPANGSNNQSTVNSNNQSGTNINKSMRDQNRNRDNSEEDGDRRKPTSNQPLSTIEPEQMRIQYIDEESLGENYEANYNVERDRQTGELIIMDYKNNIKFIIKKKKEKKRPRSQTDPEPLVIEYINRNALNSLSDFEIEYDNRTGEPFIQDPKNENHRWIILPDDWDVKDGSDYVAEEDVDLMEWNVFVENDSNRKYIIDERDGKRYYIVPKITKKHTDSFVKQFSNVITGLLMRVNSLADAQVPDISNKRQSSIQWPRPPSILDQGIENEVNAPVNKTGSHKSIKANAEELIVKDDEEKQPRRRLDEQPARIEYIDEQQLGDNYEIRYRVQFDGATGESFILDYDKNIKYVIMKKKAVKQTSEPEVVEYIMRSALDNLGGVEIEYDNRTAEPYIRDPQNENRRWIVLSDDWDEVDGAYYIPEEDVSTDWDVYDDRDSNRKYIVDEREGKRYYIVPQITDKKIDNFLKLWSQKPKKASTKEDPKKSLSLSNITQANFDSSTGANDETIKIAPDAKKNETTKRGNELMIGYVEEKDLDDVNLQNVPIFQDPLTDESYIQDPQNNRIWIILPQDWQDLGLYIPEEEIDFSGTDVFEDDTKRKYVIDDKTGYRYFIVPTMNKTQSLFKQQWPALSNLVNKYDKVLWRKDLNNININKPDNKPDSNYAFRKLPPMDVLENYDREPKYAPNKHKSSLKPFRSPRLSRKEIPRSLVLPVSPRPLHHLLLDGRFTHKRLQDMYEEMKRQEELRRTSSLSFLNQDWRCSNINDDPTASRNQSLDRDKLTDIEINGYNKERKGKRRRRSSLTSLNSKSTPQIYSSALASASGASLYSYDSPFLHGVLTEKFGTQENWKRNHRAVKPKTRLFLREQVLATPRSQERVWRDTLEKSYKLKPRIIVINDDERILAANKNCKFYVQYVHDRHSILGAAPAYLLMLPDRGPVNPTRPLMVSMQQLEENGADIALREAPVFVYHQNGNAYFENIAQYLAGKYPKLSPKTLRKILQFKSLEEFEQYLEGKMTRDEAQRILESTGLEAIDVDSVKNELLMSLSPHSPVSVAGSEHNSFYHANCEYDSLRYDNITSLNSRNSEQLYETKEVEIDGILLKSTFVSLTPSGNIERLEPEDLTPTLINAIKQADQYEEQKQLEKRFSNQNQYEKNPVASPIIKTAQNENKAKPKPGIIPLDERANLLKSKYINFNNK